MKTIKQKYSINAPVTNVWDALVNPKTIDKWGAGPAKMTDKKGRKFSLWGGDIWGVNTKVVAQKKLVQDWYAGKWEKPSIVTFTLSSSKDKTLLSLVHTNVPDSEAKDISAGWKDYYLVPLTELVEKEK